MASAYNLEPQTNAKVILHTTHGDLDLELWGAQTPLTTRNFLQLCLDGYYTGTTFHRLVPSFILQGGDPTGTGHGGEAIYDGGLFADEFHGRLRFNRRGLVGMANSGRRDDNGSQFFLTLADTRELTGRNTMFGKVVGDTLYNLVRMGQAECEEGTERPVFPVKITGAEVAVNPFEDMKPRAAAARTETAEEKAAAAAAGKRAAAKKEKKKGKALLSFGGDEEEVPEPVLKKPKFNTRLVVAAPLSEEPPAEKKVSAPSAAGAKNAITTTETVTSVTSKDTGSLAAPPEPEPEPPRTRTPSSSPEPPPSRQALRLAETNAQIAALKQSLRRDRDRDAPHPAAAANTKKKSLLAIQKSLLPATSVKGRKRKRDATAAAAGDDETLDALKRFQRKLASADTLPPTTAATKDTDAAAAAAAKSALDEDDEPALCDLHFIPSCASCGRYERASRSPSPGASGALWSHALSFEKDRLGKDLAWKKRNEELLIIDPREKEKAILKGAGRGERRGGGGRGAFRRDAGAGAEWGRRREGAAGPSGSGSGSAGAGAGAGAGR